MVTFEPEPRLSLGLAQLLLAIQGGGLGRSVQHRHPRDRCRREAQGSSPRLEIELGHQVPGNVRMTANRVALIDWDESYVDVPDLDLVLPHANDAASANREPESPERPRARAELDLDERRARPNSLHAILRSRS
jgi:hypothetical protein